MAEALDRAALCEILALATLLYVKSFVCHTGFFLLLHIVILCPICHFDAANFALYIDNNFFAYFVALVHHC